MQADYKNLKITINKLLNKDQKLDFKFELGKLRGAAFLL